VSLFFSEHSAITRHALTHYCFVGLRIRLWLHIRNVLQHCIELYFVAASQKESDGMYSKPCPASNCRVLPPNEFSGTIPEPFILKLTVSWQ